MNNELDRTHESQPDHNYQDFLRSLDNEELLTHISQLSSLTHHLQNPLKQPSFQEVSTPKALKQVSFTSVASSDPFDDGLDDILLKVDASGHLQNSFAERALPPITNEEPPHIPDEESDNNNDDDKTEESIGKLHEFGDYGTYFHSKHLKQQKQDLDYLKWEKQRRRLQNIPSQNTKPIFEGCVIFVNGHTLPSINEIHRLVILHGGKFISFLFNKSAATHIICDRLTPRKSIEFKNCRVVKAKWIVDCVEKQELLDWQEYRLILEVSYDQTRLGFQRLQQPDSAPGPQQMQQIEENQANDTDEDGLEEEHEDEEILSPLLSQSDQILNRLQQLENQEGKENEEEDVLVTLEAEPKEVKGVHKVNNKYVLDCRHPDFLPKFFANSRLHHLSTWKADLRLKFLRKIIHERKHRPRQPISSPQKNVNPFLDPNHQREKLIMHIDFDCFFATASCLNRPDLDINKDPIAVSHGGKTSDIASCNYVARSYGIKNGIWLGGAKQKCPDLVLLDYDFAAYEKYSGEFYNYLVSSDIFDTIFPVLIDEVLVDASSYCLDPAKDTVQVVNELCARIREDIFKITKCSVSVGVSSNVLLAKLALRKAKPDGYYYLHENISQFLESVPVRDLPGMGASLVEKLSNEIQSSTANPPTLKDLLPFSRSRLMTLFGEKTGTKLYQYARGIDHTSIEIDSSSNPESVLGRKSVSVDVNFGIRLDTIQELDDFLMRLARELYTRLINLGICGSGITLKLAKRAPKAPVNPPKFLGMGWCEYVNKSARLGVPTNDWGVIGAEVKVLYRMMNVPVKELRGIAITITRLRDVESVKESRQMRLPFNQITSAKELGNVGDQIREEFEKEDKKRKRLVTPTTSPLKVQKTDRVVFEKEQWEKYQNRKRIGDRVSGHFHDISAIDWEVFESLPDEIKREVEHELSRRGLLSDTKPTKLRAPPNSKVYLQQLLPTQSGSAPKFVRVIESPKKKSPQKRTRSATTLPVKQLPPAYEESQSYDSAILDELPSSVRASVMKDIAYKKKIKKFDLVPVRDKIARKFEQSKTIVSEITKEWISDQPKLTELPLFLNQKLTARELDQNLRDWVKTSLDQCGPHQDDVNYFMEYMKAMLVQDDLCQCLLMVRTINKALEYHKSIIPFTSHGEEELSLLEQGIEDWHRQLDGKIIPAIKQYCAAHNLTLKW